MKIFLSAFFLSILFTGCNPGKQVMKNQQQYQALINDYLAKHPVRIDTTTELIPGGVDTVYNYIQLTDTSGFKALRDSLQNALADKEKDCSREINEAFTAGYKQAIYLQNIKGVVKPRPDTVKIKIYPTDQINALRDLNALQQTQLQQKDSIIKSNSKWLWWFIGSALLNLLFVLLILRIVRK